MKIVKTFIINRPNPAWYHTPFFLEELSSGTTHCSVWWNRLRAQREVNWLLFIQFLSTKSLFNIPPPVFAWNYHQAQPTVLSVGLGSDSTEVKFYDFWDIHYPPKPLLIFHLLFPHGIIIRHNPLFCLSE